MGDDALPLRIGSGPLELVQLLERRSDVPARTYVDNGICDPINAPASAR